MTNIFRLQWPVEPPIIITQGFGLNPDRYKPYGFPGHEGTDFHAPDGAKVLAAADGKVLFVGFVNPSHPYGYMIRLQHDAGGVIYQTLYCHGHNGSAVVQVGDFVRAGQLLMLADNTGRSTGSHLHFTLVRLTDVSHTDYPRGVMNPTPFFSNVVADNEHTVNANAQPQPDRDGEPPIDYDQAGQIERARLDTTSS